VDDAVARSLAKWPNVPAVFGWLSLDRRGQWRIKGERIANRALNEFIGRNYDRDAKGRWFFQNGPQRVYVSLAYTPLVIRVDEERLVDQCGRPFSPAESFVDDEGSMLMTGSGTVALLDDRDLARYADGAEELPRINRAEVAAKFGFVPDPAP